MKKIFIYLFTIAITLTVKAQTDFSGYMATAKTSYSSGKLEDAHFALQQAMQEIDMVIGKEVLKILPQKLNTLNLNPKDDHVMANTSFIGATISRSYGPDTSGAKIEIINNSPMITYLNSILNMPVLGGMMRDENNKTLKVQGYKARLEKQPNASSEKATYVLNIPLNTALVTFTVRSSTEAEVMNYINSIPLQQIAKLVN
jgi:hypothetical protein